jgi:tripartite motif-containing protein 2/3
LEVTTGEGVTVKLQLPLTATVLRVKQEVESKLGIRPREACVFSGNKAHSDKLQDEITLDSLLVGEGSKLELLLLVEQADAQQVVPELAVEPSMVLGDGTSGNGNTQLKYPIGASFIAAHPDWLVISEMNGDRIKISNIRTGALVCKFSENGKRVAPPALSPPPLPPLAYSHLPPSSPLIIHPSPSLGEGPFCGPRGVAVTSDSSFVIVADYGSHRVQVLRLVVGADGISAHLEFVCSLGSGGGSAEGQLCYPSGVTLLQSNGGQQETVLVTEEDNHRVSQFALDGTFVGIFAGTGEEGGGSGEFKSPQGITVLGSSGEVAVADQENHRVQIFDSEGKYKRQFGTVGEEADGQLCCPSNLASDAHGNLLVLDHTSRLQVFDPEGKHLCTRSDLGLDDSENGIAWSTGGEVAVANGEANNLLMWCPA